DYLTAHTLGPIAVADPSRGLVARVWKARTADGREVRLAGANGAGNAWTDEVLLFTIDDGGPPILELDIAFEQNGQPVVCLERATGVGGASEVWIWFFDPTVPGMVLRNFGPGRTPRALLDRPIEIADGDVLVFYVADHAGRIAYRQQRDRYAVEILTPFEANRDTFVEDVAKGQDRRVVLLYSQRDEATGTYALHAASSVLSPITLPAEALEPARTITALSLDEIMRAYLARPEALTGSRSLRHVQLRDLIIIYNPSPEALDPRRSLVALTVQDLVKLYTMGAEAVTGLRTITSVSVPVVITIDRSMTTEAVAPKRTITAVTLEAA